MKKKHIFLIIALVIVVAGAGLLLMNKPSEPKSTEPPIINQPPENFICEDLYKEIENDIDNANYCQTNSDCDVLLLGDWYVDFGCYHLINKDVDKEQFYKKMKAYKQKCSQRINKCAPAPEAKCVSNKCVYVEEKYRRTRNSNFLTKIWS